MIGVFRLILKDLLWGLEDLEKLEIGNRLSGVYSNYKVVEVAKSTENSSGDLRTLDVTLTPVEDHQ